MKTPIRFFAMLFGSLLLAAGSDHARASAFGPPPGDNVNIDVSASSIGTNSTATLTVTVTRRNGTPENDGTLISAIVSPASLGSIAGSGSSGGVASSTSPLSGGVASFVFIANNTPGTATITVSVPPVNGHPTTVTSKVNITVTPGDGNNPSLKVTPSTVTLPQNLVGAGPALGSPYMAEVQVEWRGLITGQLLNGKISVATSPVGSIAFSTLDDPTTPWTGETKTPPTAEGNEFLTELGSGPVNVTAGIGTIFIHSGAAVGPATLTITAVDPETNRTISSQIAVDVITPPGANLPTAVTLSQAAGGVYINGSNGPQSKLVTATVTNIYGTPAIAAPGVDNVQFDIVGPSGTDAKLFAISAAGAPQVGSSVKTATGASGASVYLVAGNVQGPVQIRATVDGDGDVDGSVITTPITATTSVVVSDGQLYSLTITSPMVNAIAVNGITASSGTGSGSGSGGTTIPTQPDATYSLTVSAIATDRGGNPVLPGTPIRFGLIDAPQWPDHSSTCPGLGAFQICGWDGNPQPAAMSFSAPDGTFRTAGGGAGPGDTLVVFGKQWQGAPAGNDDFESAQLIAGIVDNTRLFTIFPFNRNDTTGAPVASGPVLPYVIGRATIGNINSPVMTDSSGAATVTGTATTKLNYPSSQLNRSVVVYAQGTGTDAVGGTRTVTDAIVTVYPAVADLIVSASPNPIPGNVPVPVLVCVVDALHVPISGMRFSFSFSNLGVGAGTVDTISTAGWTNEITDSTGCLTAQVTTEGIAGTSSGSGGSGGSGSSGTPTLSFAAAGYAAGGPGSVSIPITAGGDLILLASPSALPGNGGNVSLTLRSSNGKAVPGVQLSGTCTGNTVSLQSGPGTTDANGQTSATITANLDAYGKVNTGSCTFTTGTGSPTATVNLSGKDLCVNDPTNSACTTGGTGGGGSGNQLSVQITTSSTNPAIVTLGGTTQFSPSGTGSCSVTPANSPQTCTWTVATGVTSVSLTASTSTVVWGGDCTGATKTISVTMKATTSCTATFP